MNDPINVLELLEEYLQVREGEILPAEISATFSEEFLRKYPKEFLEGCVSGNSQLVCSKKYRDFCNELLLLGIDLEYRRYLGTHKHTGDQFGVMLDRDSKTHSENQLRTCYQYCQEHGYHFFLSNPCFEIWLVCHFMDYPDAYTEEELLLLEEADDYKVKEILKSKVSSIAHHGKKIPNTAFCEVYWPNIGKAMKNARKLATQFDDIMEHVGTNIADLFVLMGFPED